MLLINSCSNGLHLKYEGCPFVCQVNNNIGNWRRETQREKGTKQLYVFMILYDIKLVVEIASIETLDIWKQPSVDGSSWRLNALTKGAV